MTEQNPTFPSSSSQTARVRHLDHLNMTVENLASSLTFYREIFGFQMVETGVFDPVPWAVIKSGEAMLCLYEHPDVPQGPHFPQRPNEQGLRHFALRIENGPDFHALVQARGLELLFGGPIHWPHSTSYYLRDPSGHHIEVVAWNDDTIAFDPLEEVTEGPAHVSGS